MMQPPTTTTVPSNKILVGMKTSALNDLSYILLTLQNYFKSTFQVKVFAWSPFDNQLF